MNVLVDSYIDALPENQQRICGKIRDMLFAEVPGIQEKFSFKIPFYHLHGKMFCYMNKVENNIEFCITRGKELSLAFPEIIVGNRKLIGGVLLANVKDIATNNIKAIIHTAAELQLEYCALNKKRK
jgi:uncharacterized protein